MGVEQRYLQELLKTGNSLVSNNILPFSLMFDRAERLLYFDIFGVFPMNLRITLCLPLTSLVNFPFSV